MCRRDVSDGTHVVCMYPQGEGEIAHEGLLAAEWMCSGGKSDPAAWMCAIKTQAGHRSRLLRVHRNTPQSVTLAASHAFSR